MNRITSAVSGLLLSIAVLGQVFSPSMLLVAQGFTWADFVITFTGCVIGEVFLAAALSKFLLVELKRSKQLVWASRPC